jgi:chemotaxis protein methyltransferase WspC
MTDPSLAALAASIASTLGLDPEAIGSDMVGAGIARRMAAVGLADPDRYARLVTDSPAERILLLEDLVSRETWFFRDQEPFTCLRNLAAARRAAPLRILSVPCATGEEPYSIALTLLQAGWTPDRFRILAADISPLALEIARRAVYRPASFRGVNPEIRDRYFSPGPEGFRLHDEVARLVAFQTGDLTDPAFLGGEPPFPIIFCRNLLIYLRPEARAAVAATLDRLLDQDGVLFTGHSELAFFIERGFAPHPHPRSFAVCRPTPPRPTAGPFRTPPAATAAQAQVLPASSPARNPQPPPPAASNAPAPESAAQTPGLDTIRELADRGDLVRAADQCEALLRRRPAEADAWHLLGLIRLAANQPEPAQRHFQRALYLAPHHTEALLCLSLIHDQRGETDRARACRERLERAGTNP